MESGICRAGMNSPFGIDLIHAYIQDQASFIVDETALSLEAIENAKYHFQFLM